MNGEPAPDGREPIDAEFEPATRSQPVRQRRRGGGGASSLATALSLTVAAAGVGGIAGALAARAPGVAGFVDAIAPNELAQVRAAQSAADAQLAAIRDNGGLTPEARAELDAVRASLAAIEGRLAAWDQGLRLLPGGPQEFEPLRRRLAAIESLPADPSAATPQRIARNAAALDARVRTLEEATAGALAYQAAAAKLDPAAITRRLDGVAAEITALDQRLAGAATASEVKLLAGELQTARERLATIARDATLASESAQAAFALAALTDAAAGTAPFPQAHAALAAALPTDPNVKALEGLARTGAPSRAQLAEEFKAIELDLTRVSRASAAGGGTWGAVQGALAPYVLVRRLEAGETTDDIVARAAARLASGNLEGAVQDVERLGGDARRRANPWLSRARQRIDLDQRLAAIRAELARGALRQ